MSRTMTKTRLPLRFLAMFLGSALLVYLVERAGTTTLLKNAVALGWGLTLVIALGGVAHGVKTWAWRLTLAGEKHDVSFLRMLGLRLASEAVGQLGFFGQAFGEGVRVSLLSPTMPLSVGISSVTIDRALFVVSAAIVTILGMVAALITLPLNHNLSIYGGLFAIALLGSLLVSGLAVRQRWPVLSKTARLAGRVRYFKAWMERERSLIDSIENKLLDFYHETPRAFWGSLSLNLLCHGFAVSEVYLILWLMGAKISIFAALAIEALTKLVNVVGVFNPGNIGTYEGGGVLIGKMFGLSAAVGLTLAMCRRLRALFWAVVGGLWLVVLSRSTKQSSSYDGVPALSLAATNPVSPQRSPNQDESTAESHVAVVLANNLHGRNFGSLLKVGTLRLLLRAILGAKKAGAPRIVVVVDAAIGPAIERDLLTTKRLPESVEWLYTRAGETPLARVLERAIAEAEEHHVVLIAADRTYQPSLHRRVSNWNGERALALTTGSQVVGLYALSRDIAFQIGEYCPPTVDSLDDLHAWLTSMHLVQCEPVPEDSWQHVLTAEDRISAEEKLDRWLVKPTDGIFARMNRRISIPMSRQIIKFPITPNMVSLFTLGVSFAAGVFFAFGSYMSMLVGAVLSVWASILDGCDGEVARLKMQESDFGCWLETICDYLSYLFTFAGITIGLWRGSGTQTYVVWGALFGCGALLSFIIIGFQRRRLVGRPEQYLRVWHAQADSRRWNPLLYIGRHTEFIIRRCFLPYAILFFAVFNILKVAFVMSAVGVNLVWIIALYSCYAFAATHTTRVAESAATA